MKETLALALCFAALATPASAAPKLPDKMLGYWCFTRAHYYPDEEFEPDIVPLVRAENFDGCANNGGARFWRHGSKTNLQFGRFQWRADCKIRKFERIGNKYRVSADCTANRGIFYTGEDSQKRQHETRFFEIWRAKPGMRWQELGENSTAKPALQEKNRDEQSRPPNPSASAAEKPQPSASIVVVISPVPTVPAIPD